MRQQLGSSAHASLLDPLLAWPALFGGHHVDIARHKGHLLAPVFGTLHFQRFVLGNGLRAFEPLPALFANGIVRSAYARIPRQGRRRQTQNLTLSSSPGEVSPRSAPAF